MLKLATVAFLFFLYCFCWIVEKAYAQNTASNSSIILAGSAPSDQPPTPPTVKDLLSTSIPKWNQPHRLFLYVEPNYTVPIPTSPPDPDNLPDLSTPEGIAAWNGFVTEWIGHVLAIAPASMTVLNTESGLFDLPLYQLEMMHPLPALLGSLTQEQFDLFAGSGLGMVDLTPDQQALLKSALPNPFEIVSSSTDEPFATTSEAADPAGNDRFEEKVDEFRKEVVTVPPDEVLREVRLHAYINEDYSLPTANGNEFFTTHGNGTYSSGDYKLTFSASMGGQEAIARQLTTLLVSHEPNQPKTGDITWHRPELASQVSLTGIKTVDDLVKSIAKATHLTLYADTSYGQLAVLIAGDPKESSTAAELMQALALCVTGTWRQVGPAYVLTNDKIGLTTRQQFLNDVCASWSNRLETADDAVSLRLEELDWMDNLLLPIGDTVDIPTDQLLSICSNGTKHRGVVKWSDIPASVQTAIEKAMSDDAANLKVDSNDPDWKVPNDLAAEITKLLQNIKQDMKVGVDANLEFALELPRTGAMSFQPFDVKSVKHGYTLPVSTDKIKMPESTRGVLCAPKTVSDAVKTVDMLPQLGFNTLFLDVFNNGRSYFQNSAVPPETDEAGSVLTAALSEAKAKGIKVYAVVDLLCWRKDGDSTSPAIWRSQFDQDLDVFGEPEDISVLRRLHQDSLNPSTKYAPIPMINESWVSPLDVTVRKILPELMKQLAATPGLAGISVQDSAPPGYDGVTDDMDTDLDLGYTAANRLTYLQAAHNDPVDEGIDCSATMELPFGGGLLTPIDVQIDGFRSWSHDPDSDTWSKLRVDADLSLVKDCYQAAFIAKPNLPIFMRERQRGLTFDPWKNANWVNQITPDATQSQSYNYINDQSVMTLPAAAYLKLYPKSLSYIINALASQAPHQPGAIALDLENEGTTSKVTTLLEQLAPFLETNMAK